ncbi:MAG TPA: hypothetical protein VIM61_03025 [Chthoniobacterales bacterium]|jgi:hypothetical protein
MLSSKKITSGHEILAILNCHRLPGRLTTAETAVLLGFQEHDIAPLVAAKMLTPLGKPAPNAPKYFAAIEVQACAENRDWLSQATKALTQHWHRKNSRKRTSQSDHPTLELEDES